MKPIKLMLTLSLALSLNTFSDTIGQEVYFKYWDNPIEIRLLNQNGDVIASTESGGRILLTLQMINTQENENVRIEFKEENYQYRFKRDLFLSPEATEPIFQSERFTFRALIDYINENDGMVIFYIHRRS